MGFKTIQPACDSEDILRIDCTLNKVMDFSNSQETPPRRRPQRIKDAEIKYLLYNGTGRALGLLQATGLPPGLGHPIAQELSRFYRSIAPFYCDPDARIGPTERSVGDTGRRPESFCDNFQMDKPVVVGHSMGGTVTALFLGGIKNNPRPLFPRITCPVLVLEGEISENRIYTELEKALTLIPRGSYVLVQGAGHPIPRERPKEVTSIIMKFFREDNF